MTTDDDHAYCERLVRDADKDRYLACLFAPADKRPALFALYAFNVEILRVRDYVSDPLPGEMRLQWWRDALSGQGHGDVERHPVAACLIETIRRYDLPVQTFLDYLEARTFDLYDDPMPDLNDLEGYAGETSSALLQLAAMILGRDFAAAMTDAAGHGGVALAITGILIAFPRLAARGQVYLPMSLLTANGASREEVVSGQARPQVAETMRSLRSTARHHIDATREHLDGVDPDVAIALLPVALARPYLDRMDKPDYDPFETAVEIPQWRRQWILWRSARRIGRR